MSSLLQRVTQEVPALLAHEGDHTVTGAKRGVTVGDEDVALMLGGSKDQAVGNLGSAIDLPTIAERGRTSPWTIS